MLSNAPIRAYIPASNIPRARRFYEQLIALKPKEEYAGGVIYECGGAEVFLYPTPNAGTSKASQAYWSVADVEAEVADLKSRGVKFEEYNMPGMKMTNSIVTAAAPKPPGSKTPKATSSPSASASNSVASAFRLTR
jgi:predicted enzyme related to lactoylglutathione lyase